MSLLSRNNKKTEDKSDEVRGFFSSLSDNLKSQLKNISRFFTIRKFKDETKKLEFDINCSDDDDEEEESALINDQVYEEMHTFRQESSALNLENNIETLKYTEKIIDNYANNFMNDVPDAVVIEDVPSTFLDDLRESSTVDEDGNDIDIDQTQTEKDEKLEKLMKTKQIGAHIMESANYRNFITQRNIASLKGKAEKVFVNADKKRDIMTEKMITAQIAKTQKLKTKLADTRAAIITAKKELIALEKKTTNEKWKVGSDDIQIRLDQQHEASLRPLKELVRKQKIKLLEKRISATKQKKLIEELQEMLKELDSQVQFMQNDVTNGSEAMIRRRKEDFSKQFQLWLQRRGQIVNANASNTGDNNNEVPETNDVDIHAVAKYEDFDLEELEDIDGDPDVVDIGTSYYIPQKDEDDPSAISRPSSSAGGGGNKRATLMLGQTTKDSEDASVVEYSEIANEHATMKASLEYLKSQDAVLSDDLPVFKKQIMVDIKQCKEDLKILGITDSRLKGEINRVKHELDGMRVDYKHLEQGIPVVAPQSEEKNEKEKISLRNTIKMKNAAAAFGGNKKTGNEGEDKGVDEKKPKEKEKERILSSVAMGFYMCVSTTGGKIEVTPSMITQSLQTSWTNNPSMSNQNQVEPQPQPQSPKTSIDSKSPTKGKKKKKKAAVGAALISKSQDNSPYGMMNVFKVLSNALERFPINIQTEQASKWAVLTSRMLEVKRFCTLIPDPTNIAALGVLCADVVNQVRSELPRMCVIKNKYQPFSATITDLLAVVSIPINCDHLSRRCDVNPNHPNANADDTNANESTNKNSNNNNNENSVVGHVWNAPSSLSFEHNDVMHVENFCMKIAILLIRGVDATKLDQLPRSRAVGEDGESLDESLDGDNGADMGSDDDSDDENYDSFKLSTRLGSEAKNMKTPVHDPSARRLKHRILSASVLLDELERVFRLNINMSDRSMNCLDNLFDFLYADPMLPRVVTTEHEIYNNNSGRERISQGLKLSMGDLKASVASSSATTQKGKSKSKVKNGSVSEIQDSADSDGLEGEPTGLKAVCKRRTLVGWSFSALDQDDEQPDRNKQLTKSEIRDQKRRNHAFTKGKRIAIVAYLCSLCVIGARNDNCAKEFENVVIKLCQGDYPDIDVASEDLAFWRMKDLICITADFEAPFVPIIVLLDMLRRILLEDFHAARFVERIRNRDDKLRDIQYLNDSRAGNMEDLMRVGSIYADAMRQQRQQRQQEDFQQTKNGQLGSLLMGGGEGKRKEGTEDKLKTNQPSRNSVVENLTSEGERKNENENEMNIIKQQEQEDVKDKFKKNHQLQVGVLLESPRLHAHTAQFEDAKMLWLRDMIHEVGKLKNQLVERIHNDSDDYSQRGWAIPSQDLEDEALGAVYLIHSLAGQANNESYKKLTDINRNLPLLVDRLETARRRVKTVINVFGDALRKDLERSNVRKVELYNQRWALMNNTQDKIHQAEAKMHIYRAQGEAIKEKMAYLSPEGGLDSVMAELLLDPDGDGGIKKLAAKCTDIHHVRKLLRRKLQDVHRRREESKNLENDLRILENTIKQEEEKKRQADMLARLAHLMEDGEIDLEAAMEELGLEDQQVDGLDSLSVSAFIQLAELNANKSFKLRLLQNLGQTARMTRLARATSMQIQNRIPEENDYATDSSGSDDSFSSKDPDSDVDVHIAPISPVSRNPNPMGRSDSSSPLTVHLNVSVPSTAPSSTTGTITGTSSEQPDVNVNEVSASASASGNPQDSQDSRLRSSKRVSFHPPNTNADSDTTSKLKENKTISSEEGGDSGEDFTLTPTQEKELRRQRKKERRLQKAASRVRGSSADLSEPLNPQLQGLSTQISSNNAAISLMDDNDYGRHQTKSNLSQKSGHLVKQLSSITTKTGGNTSQSQIQMMNASTRRASQPLSLEDIEKRVIEEARISRISLEVGGVTAMKRRKSSRRQSSRMRRKSSRSSNNGEAQGSGKVSTISTATQDSNGDVQYIADYWDHGRDHDAADHSGFDVDTDVVESKLQVEVDSGHIDVNTDENVDDEDNHSLNAPVSLTFTSPAQAQLTSNYLRLLDDADGTSQEVLQTLQTQGEINKAFQDVSSTIPGMSAQMQFKVKTRDQSDSSSSDSPRLPIFGNSIAAPDLDHILGASRFMKNGHHSFGKDSNGNLFLDYSKLPDHLSLEVPVRDRVFEGHVATDYRAPIIPVNIINKVTGTNNANPDKTTNATTDAATDSKIDAASTVAGVVSVVDEVVSDAEAIAEINIGTEAEEGVERIVQVNVGDVVATGPLSAKYINNPSVKVKSKVSRPPLGEREEEKEIQKQKRMEEEEVEKEENLDIGIDILDVNTIDVLVETTENETREIVTNPSAGDDVNAVKATNETTTTTTTNVVTTTLANVDNATISTTTAQNSHTIAIVNNGISNSNQKQKEIVNAGNANATLNKDSTTDGIINAGASASAGGVTKEKEVKDLPSILKFSTMEEEEYKPMSKMVLSDEIYLKLDMQLKNREQPAGLVFDRHRHRDTRPMVSNEDDEVMTYYTKEGETIGEIGHNDTYPTTTATAVSTAGGDRLDTDDVKIRDGLDSGLGLGLQVKKAKRHGTIRHMLLYEKYKEKQAAEAGEDDQKDEEEEDEGKDNDKDKSGGLTSLLGGGTADNNEIDDDVPPDYDSDDSIPKESSRGSKSSNATRKKHNPIRGRRKEDRQNFNGFTNLIPAPPKQPQRSGGLAPPKNRAINNNKIQEINTSISTMLTPAAITSAVVASTRVNNPNPGKGVMKPGRLLRLNEHPIYLSMKSNLIMSSQTDTSSKKKEKGDATYAKAEKKNENQVHTNKTKHTSIS